MEKGKILYTMVENTCILKLTGAIVYKLSPGFDRFLQKVFEDSSIDKFIVDLTETCHIDSTNLGLLARLHDHSSRKSDRRPTIVSTNETINEVLKNVGFANMFNIIESLEDVESDFNELPKEDSNEKNVSEVMLKAHRELTKLNDLNKEMFKDVVKYLEEESLNNLSLSI